MVEPVFDEAKEGKIVREDDELRDSSGVLLHVTKGAVERILIEARHRVVDDNNPLLFHK
ncbi:hypothetical protein D3C86_2266690 [compost metagenome]